MKEYVSPAVEFIEFEENDVICASCDEYVCPNSYGGTCSGNPYTKLQDGVSKNSSKKKDDIVKVGFDLTFDK